MDARKTFKSGLYLRGTDIIEELNLEAASQQIKYYQAKEFMCAMLPTSPLGPIEVAYNKGALDIHAHSVVTRWLFTYQCS